MICYLPTIPLIWQHRYFFNMPQNGGYDQVPDTDPVGSVINWLPESWVWTFT
jgi:hypothetical protein